MQNFCASSGVWLRLSAAALLVSISCGGGSCGGAGGCGGCEDTGYTYPTNDPNRPDSIVQDDAMRVRITQDFLDFIRPQLPDLLRSQLAGSGGMTIDADGVLHIPIPNTDLFDFGIASANVRQAEAFIWLDDLQNRLDLSFEEPNGARLTMNNLRLGVSLRLKENVAGTTSSCPIFGNLGPLGPGPLRHAAEVSIETLIDPGVGPSPDFPLDIRVTVDDVALDDLDLVAAGSSVYCQEPECQDCIRDPIWNNCIDPPCLECETFCGLVTGAVVDIATGLIDLIRPLLNRILRPIVENLLGDTLNSLNGSTAKIETAIAVADLAGIAALKNANDIGVFVAPRSGRFPVLDRGNGLGMEITVNAGAEGELADCIPVTDPFIPNRGPVPDLKGTDARGRPYHIGVTLAQAYLNQIFDAVHRSGTLCLKLGSKDVRELTGGAFTLNASILSLLASDISQLAADTAPVILEIKPRNAGYVDLGTGMVTGMDAMGNNLYDWLIKLSLEDMGIAFHVFMHDRYVRVFEVTSDVFVGLNVNVLPDNTLEVAVGELRIDDFQETFNEIVPNADFAMILPTLLDLALGAFLNDTLKFDVDITDALSDALGGAPIYMRVNEIFRDGLMQDYLTMTITMTSSRTGNLSLAAETDARLHPMDDGLLERVAGARRPTGRVRLEVGQLLGYTHQQQLEYQVRVDSGLWRAAVPARPDGTIYVQDPKLRMPGAHWIEVRARYQGDYETLDPTPAVIDAMVDPYAPSLSARAEEEAVRIRVRDVETVNVATLSLRARLDDGAWFDLSVSAMADVEHTGVAELSWASVGDARLLEVRALDASGNESAPLFVNVGLGPTAETIQVGDKPATGCACQHARATRDGWAGALLAAALGLLFVLRTARQPLRARIPRA